MATRQSTNRASSTRSQISPEITPEALNQEHTDNWLTLAEHIQAKVLKRTSDVSYLHAKAGFLIAAGVVVLQLISSFHAFTDSLAIFAVGSAVALTVLSIILSITSMIMSKSASPLNIDDMILLMNKGKMRREVFAKWLVDCYNLANKEFNKVYSRKYYQQITAAIILVVAIVIIVIMKGIELYVKH